MTFSVFHILPLPPLLFSCFSRLKSVFKSRDQRQQVIAPAQNYEQFSILYIKNKNFRTEIFFTRKKCFYLLVNNFITLYLVFELEIFLNDLNN